MTMDIAEQFAEQYLRKQPLRPERFGKGEMRQGKTPDFRVFKHEELVAYCEAKHVQRDDWLDQQLVSARPLQFVGGLRPDPIFNRLTAHIHRAAKQFAAVNANHEFANILVFVNSDRAFCTAEDLRRVITGMERLKGEQDEPMFSEYSEGRIRYEKFTIDMYVWWDSWKNPEKFTRYLWRESAHRAALDILLPRTDLVSAP